MKIIKNKAGFTIGLIILLVFCVFFVFNFRKVSASEEVKVNLEKIDESIQKEISNHTLLALSSNPYDYIADNEYYDNIIKLGISALPELEATLNNSDENGLNEYILAIAIEDITCADVNAIQGNIDYGWENAKEFEIEWSDIKSDVTESVGAIIQSVELTEEEKIDNIGNYGILAVPAIDSFLSTPQARTKNSIRGKLNDLRESYELNEREMKIINDIISE